MEIAKFVLTCIGSFIAVSGFFMGFWKAYKKKVDDKIARTRDEAEARIAEVNRLSSAKTEKLEKRVETLENTVTALQKEVNSNLGERLSNIEGTMKKMDNILTQIQNWFINNTPRS